MTSMFVLWVTAAAIFDPSTKVLIAYPGHFPTIEACETAGRDYMASVARYGVMERVYGFKCYSWDHSPLEKKP